MESSLNMRKSVLESTCMGLQSFLHGEKVVFRGVLEKLASLQDSSPQESWRLSLEGAF